MKLMSRSNSPKRTTMVMMGASFVVLLLAGNQIHVSTMTAASTYDESSFGSLSARRAMVQIQADDHTAEFERETAVENTILESELPSSFFDLTNPIWPTESPKVNSNCSVRFRDPNLSLCNIIPYKDGNFGDELGPPIVKRILELYFQCNADSVATSQYSGTGEFLNRTKPCLMTVGSLWRMVKTNDHLWGTGTAFHDVIEKRCRKNTPLWIRNLTIYSSRGPLSATDVPKYCGFAKNNDGNSIPTAGDAGFLIPFLFPEYLLQGESNAVDNKKSVCAIPHHVEEKSKKFQHIPQNLTLTVGRSWENMTMEMQHCKQVVSSSLHGVILAEALGIPSRRMRCTYKPGDFKFRDFYESYRGQELPPANSVKEATDSMTAPLRKELRDAYARLVLKTFPIHLFETVSHGSGGLTADS